MVLSQRCSAVEKNEIPSNGPRSRESWKEENEREWGPEGMRCLCSWRSSTSLIGCLQSGDSKVEIVRLRGASGKGFGGGGGVCMPRVRTLDVRVRRVRRFVKLTMIVIGGITDAEALDLVARCKDLIVDGDCVATRLNQKMYFVNWNELGLY